MADRRKISSPTSLDRLTPGILQQLFFKTMAKKRLVRFYSSNTQFYRTSLSKSEVPFVMPTITTQNTPSRLKPPRKTPLQSSSAPQKNPAIKTTQVRFGSSDAEQSVSNPSEKKSFWERTKTALSAAKQELFGGKWTDGWGWGLVLCIVTSPLPGSQLFVVPTYMIARRLYRGIKAAVQAF
jgi:hypothetical protein